MLNDYFPVILQALAAIGFAGAALGLSVLLGKRGSHNETKETPYECGMLPIGQGAPRFSVKFYLVAMLFVIFDIEAVFIYPWAVAFTGLSFGAFLAMGVFILLLAEGLIYLWIKGVLTWK